MAVLVTNSFSSYEMTEEEVREGSILTITQVQLLQSDMATLSEEKLALIFTPSNLDEFIQQEAYLSGQITNIRCILDRSLNAIEERSNPNPEV